jgi:predicted amidohydrolase YtcJ
METYRKGRNSLCGLALFGVLGFFATGLAAQQSGPAADVIFHNGKVLTVDKSFSIAEAIAVRGNQIAAVGTNQQIMALSGPDTRVFDLKGKTVIPGLLNTHVHLNDDAETNYGGMIGYDKLLVFPINWSAVKTLEDVLSQVRQTIQKYQIKAGEWVFFASRGSGMTPEGARIMLADLNGPDLDRAAPDNPIVMAMNWPNYNGLLVSGKAVDIIWAQYGDYVKKYGRFWIDEGGRPNGHLEQPANRLALDFTPKPRPEDMGPIFKLAAEELNAEGITGISVQFPQYAIDAVKHMESRGEWNNLRFGYGKADEFGMIQNLTDDPKLKELGQEMNTGSDMFWVVSATPTALDGSSSRACSSHVRQEQVGPYDEWYPIGQCPMDSEYKGGSTSARVPGHYFRDWLTAGARYGYRLANVHAAGDRSVKLTIDLMEQLQREMGPAAARGWAVDHCRMVDPADIPRAAKVGLNFSCAASLGSDSEAASYGAKIAETFPSPVKTMFKNGVNVSVDAGSFETFERFVTRKDNRGKVWGPDERLTREEALRVFTQNGANYMLRGDKFGSLEVERFADLVVLDKDLMTIPEDDISTIQPQMTMVAGKAVWAQPSFVSEYNLAPAPGMVVGTLKDLQARRKPSGISRR